MTAPDFTIADVLAWARSKPADERYDATNADACALGQFGSATGRTYLQECFDPDKELCFSGLNDALGFSGGELTFGAIADRLEALAASQ